MSNVFSSSSMSSLVVLTVVLVLVWLGLRLLRDRLAAAASRLAGSTDTLRIVRTMPVGSRERVVLVEHRGEQLLLGVATGSVNLLARWPQDVPPASDAPPADVTP